VVGLGGWVEELPGTVPRVQVLLNLLVPLVAALGSWVVAVAAVVAKDLQVRRYPSQEVVGLG